MISFSLVGCGWSQAVFRCGRPCLGPDAKVQHQSSPSVHSSFIKQPSLKMDSALIKQINIKQLSANTYQVSYDPEWQLGDGELSLCSEPNFSH